MGFMTEGSLISKGGFEFGFFIHESISDSKSEWSCAAFETEVRPELGCFVNRFRMSRFGAWISRARLQIWSNHVFACDGVSTTEASLLKGCFAGVIFP